ncbi:MAG: hypothetical protein WC992_06755 [Acholeplasmataceae bacterium]
MIELGLFRTVLEVLIKNGLPIVAIYWLLERPAFEKDLEAWKGFYEGKLGLNKSKMKRICAMVLSVVLSMGLYILYAKMVGVPLPTTFEGWGDVILTLGAINYGGTQLVHAKDLR